jgi:CubicO group peptidase (beta-lactamase class C family)
MLALASAAPAQEAKSTPQSDSVPPIEQRVETFVNLLETVRQQLAVPGAAVVVAHRDRVIRTAALGRRNLETQEPVTEDTVFNVGSVTKQFTAMAVALAVSEGKMAFEDHPRRYLPPFHLQDPEADANVNLIDLLAHRTGLFRSDVTFLSAPFTQAELFELASRSQPVAGLRQAWLYNNVMVTLPGACVGAAYGTSYERFLTERLLLPLGMRSSTLTLEALEASSNRAIGYARTESGETRLAKRTDPTSIAPAGALNTTARDMGAWLLFLNSHGQRAPQIAAATYARVFEPHQQTGSASFYGLGFFLETRSDVLVAHHGGAWSGYSALVVHVPERELSFALLTNQDMSPLSVISKELFWETVVRPEVRIAAAPPGEPQPPTPTADATPPQLIATDLLIGEYFATLGGTFEINKTDGGDLVWVVPGQPPYPLKATSVNVHTVTGIRGASLTFTPSPDMPGRITVLVRQPGRSDFIYHKKDDAWLARAKAQYDGPEKELIGRYRSVDRRWIMEIAPFGHGVALIMTIQPPFPLKKVDVDLFALEGLPEAFRVLVRRWSNRILGFGYQEAGGIVELGLTEGDVEAGRSILERAVTAAGGADALDRIGSKTAVGQASAPWQGLDGRTEDEVITGKRAELIELGAFGKTFKFQTVTNEQRSLDVSPDHKLAAEGKGLESAQLFAVPHPLHRWRERFGAVAAIGPANVNGENAVVIELTPRRSLATARLYISSTSFLILRDEVPAYKGDELQSASRDADYSDYRIVKGIAMPFVVTVMNPAVGKIVLSYETISLDNPIDPAVFDAP